MEASFKLGICRYYEGDYDAAIRLFRMVSDEVPLNEVLNDLAAALSRRNDASAADGFKKALEGDEGDPDYWFNYGYALWKLGRLRKGRGSVSRCAATFARRHRSNQLSGKVAAWRSL